MNNGSSLSPKQYLNLVEMSDRKRILVEGRTDKKVFDSLLDALFRQVPQGISRQNIHVDVAETLIRGNTNMGPSKRERVEYICAEVQNTPEAEKLVGFVDREFREFKEGDTLRDRLNGHRVIGRLVWSRGHSLENYGFDVYILRQSLREHSRYYRDTDYFSRAFSLFENLWESAIRLACTYSLIAEEDREIDALKSIISWKIIETSPSRVLLNQVLLKQVLTERREFNAKAERLIERFHFWEERVNRADFSCVKWMCHGHIGFRFILSVFANCIVEICRQENIPENEFVRVVSKTIFHTSEDNIFETCSKTWIYESLLNRCDYPVESLVLLGLSVPENQIGLVK
jgi:hypothetical protein